MEVTDIGNKEEGRVWHRKPGPGKRLLVTVVRTVQQSKTVRFLHVAFDTTGDSFLAGDHHGNIYVFDIGRNRFRLVQKTGQACTALAFNLRRTTEFLVALADHTIKCFDKDTKQMVSWMQGHEGAVSFISVHSSGRSAISTSLDTAQLWDLDTFQRKRKLSVRQSVGVQRVFFLPLSNTILSCFSDDSIFAWESDTLSCQYQLPVMESGPQISYKAFAVAPDGKSFVAGGRSNLIHLWCLESQQLVRVIQMPTQVRAVRQLEFLPDSFDRGASQTLGVLSQDGVMRFINIQTCKLLFHLGSCDHAISTVAISPNGRHMAAIMDNGSINVYSIHSLTQEFNKLPSSQVVVVSGGEDDRELSKPKVRVRSDIIEKSTKRSGKKSQAEIPTGFPVDDKENEQAAGLSKKRLLSLLKAFGEYPAKYRMFLWRSLLCLPENYTAYSSLTDKGPHSAFLTLHNKYPIKSQKLQRCLQRVLSALAHWAAIFGEVDYLPLVAFPFVKLFQNNPLLCFEMLATVIVNWCQHWFEYFPNPPLNILAMVENVLAHHDKRLLQHLVKCGITSQVYAWPLLETLFSEVLTRDEWLRLFDSVFSNHPSFLLMACVAYVTCCRQPLLKSSQKQDFEYFFHHRNNMDVGNMIKEAYRIMDSTPSDIHPKNMLSDFTPLTKGQYPVFNHYPEFIVEYQSRKREKIRLKEMEHLCEREELSARADFMRRKAEEEAFYAQEMLQEAEEHCRAQEEERLAAGQDLDARRMELEAQRRQLEQHLLMEQERLDREVEHEVAMAMKRSAEEENNTDLLHSTHINIQAPGASLERLKRLDVVQERKRGNVTELQKQAVAEEAGLADTMRDVVGREWDEVMNTRAQLEERRQQQASGEAVRKTQMGGFPHRPCGTPAAVAGSSTAGQVVRPSVTTSLTETGTRMICLNSTSPSGSTSTIFSVNRGRAQLDSSERELLMEVRELRQKLANRARKEDRLDLSHNESARMAVDSLLSRGLKEYHQVLHAEGEVDFLSQPEKMYIMENGKDGSTAGSSTSDDQLESSFTDSQLGTQCPSLSTDSDPPAGGDPSCQRGVSNCVLMKPSFEVYFQSHGGAASMKDLIRKFMRKATETLVIVMDSFSDVELLCDLLEASRKRNVSVHLLLDHLNLNVFVSMWQELKLNSRNFPKLSVRSVQGQTYCAKTGRKLNGQITESFIITDWTEVLTGCYSFSWLSWQVHRSLAVLVKGSAVLPFHTEFLRLNSSSQTVPGFVNYIAVPHALPFSNKTLHAPQNGDNFTSDAKSVPSKLSRIEDKKAEAKAKVQFLSSLQSNRSKEMAQPAGSAVCPKPPQNVPASKSETAGGAVYICHGSQRNGEPLDDRRNHVQNHLSPLSRARVSHIESQLSGLTVSPAALKTFPTQRQCRTVQYQTANLNQDYSSVRARSFFFQQNEKDRSINTLEIAVHQKNKHQWFNTRNFRAKNNFLSPCPKSPSSSTPLMNDLKKDLLLPLIRPRGLRCGLQGREDHQPRLQSPPTMQPSTRSVPAAHLKAQLQAGSKVLSPGAKPNQEAPLRLNWKSKSHAAKSKLSPRHSFLSSLYRPVWRPFHSNASVSLRRSISFTETHPSSFPKTVLLTDASKS